MKNILFILIFVFLPFLMFAEQVEATNKGIANASPGYYIIRENGDKVILNQSDIDYARTSNEKYFGSGYFFIIIFIIGIGVFILFKNLSKVNYYNNNQGKTYIDENGYRRFSDSNKLVHRYVVEKKIGRKLRQGEIVHHINRNKLDNSPENLEVFANQEEHEKHHKKTDWLFRLNRRIFRRFRF
jgi:hypothetical protein